MGAAANATLTYVGKSGRTYLIDVYCPDAAATQVGFNANGSAVSTSPTSWRVPEDGVIYDFSIATGTTAVGQVFSNNSGSILGGVVRYANQLNTLANRQKVKIPLRAGDFLTGLQI